MGGVVEDLVHDPGRGAPLCLVKFDNGLSCYMVTPEGISTGQQINYGGKAPAEIGNILPLGKVPEGTLVCALELRPGDGGKMAKSSGAYATVVGHTPQGTMIRLPSGRTRYVDDYCLATVGVVSAAGRIDKPFLKAGSMFHLMKAKGHKYPRVSGRKMVPACHPFGSSKRSSRRCTTTSHGAPPGQKVGLISARGPGQKKKRVIR
jgi:large subunit ribosomal protein L2